MSSTAKNKERTGTAMTNIRNTRTEQKHWPREREREIENMDGLDGWMGGWRSANSQEFLAFYDMTMR